MERDLDRRGRAGTVLARRMAAAVPSGAAGPGVATAFIINFIWNWKEYFWPPVLISSDSKKTVSLGLYGLQGSIQYSADGTGLFAGCVIVMIPTLVLYAVMSKRIMSGMSIGALKG